MTGIKKFLRSCLTPDEQKIVFFILLAGLAGIIIHFTGLQAGEEQADSLKAITEEATPIFYDINTITAKELQTIPGIGAVRAQAIIEYRDENRPVTVDDLINVRGIGNVTLNNIRRYFKKTPDDEVILNSSEPEGSAAALPEDNKEVFSPTMNINDANLEQLMEVSGVGVVRGESILDYIRERGRIKNIDQLLEIRGIGHKTLENIKELFHADNDR